MGLVGIERQEFVFRELSFSALFRFESAAILGDFFSFFEFSFGYLGSKDVYVSFIAFLRGLREMRLNKFVVSCKVRFGFRVVDQRVLRGFRLLRGAVEVKTYFLVLFFKDIFVQFDSRRSYRRFFCFVFYFVLS